jgi:tetratricopeptide (TPR) repeat protein
MAIPGVSFQNVTSQPQSMVENVLPPLQFQPGQEKPEQPLALASTMQIPFGSLPVALEQRLNFLTSCLTKMREEQVQLKNEVNELEQKNGKLTQVIQELSFKMNPPQPAQNPISLSTSHSMQMIPSQPAQNPIPPQRSPLSISHPMHARPSTPFTQNRRHSTNSATPATEHDKLEFTRKLIHEGKTKQALSYVRSATPPNNQNPEFYCLESTCLRLLQQYSDSLIAANRAILIDPDHSTALINAAIALSIQGDHFESLILIQKALQKTPHDIIALECKIQNLYNLNHFQDCQSAIRFLFDLDSSNHCAQQYASLLNM